MIFFFYLIALPYFLYKVGEIYCWGSNSHGQLGLGSSGTPESKPCLVKLLQGIPISHISCGADFSFAVTPSGNYHAIVYVRLRNDY